MPALPLALAFVVATQLVSPPLHVKHAYDIRGLTLWITAEDGITADAQGRVKQLVDKTGNFTLTPPNGQQGPRQVPKVLNGHAVLRFDGRQSLFSPDNFGSAQDRAMTFIIVARGTAPAGDECYEIYLGRNADPHYNRALCHFQGKELFDGQIVAFWGPPVLPNVFFMDSAAITANRMRATFYRDGKKILMSGLAPQNGNARFDLVSDGVTLGAAPTNLYGWQGDIAEVLVFDRDLNAAEMQTIWTALSAKYALKPAADSP